MWVVRIDGLAGGGRAWCSGAIRSQVAVAFAGRRITAAEAVVEMHIALPDPRIACVRPIVGERSVGDVPERFDRPSASLLLAPGSRSVLPVRVEDRPVF